MHHHRVADETQRDQQPAKTNRAVLRIPAAAVIAVAVLTFGITPIAWTVPGMLVLYVFPAALLYWVLRVRTTATPDGLATRTLFGGRELAWSDLKGLSVTTGGKLYAVTTDDEQVLLPTVRSHHLPTLSLISDGRIPDPTGLTADIGAREPGGGQRPTEHDEGEPETPRG